MSDYKPEVGTNCHVLHGVGDTKYIECEPLAIKDGRVVYYVPEKDSVGFLPFDCFRSIRTQEDIAREEAIEKMAIACGKGKKSIFTITSVCTDAYDAGYHNGPKVGERASHVDVATFLMLRDGYELVRALCEHYDIYKRKVEK